MMCTEHDADVRGITHGKIITGILSFGLAQDRLALLLRMTGVGVILHRRYRFPWNSMAVTQER
jgi:hypothetical protein